ncbi:MAG: DNA polymerase III subunit alpha [bacterium]
MSASFAPLHNHSHYSLLGALPKLPALVAAAKKEGCTALALTDLGNMYGTVEFVQECQHEGVKPIIGLEAYLQDGARLVLLAENESGYKNLLKLVTVSYTAEHEGRPICTPEMLAAHAGGIIAIVPYLRGEVQKALRGQESAQNRERAEKLLTQYQKLFGAENVYLEISHYAGNAEHEALFERLQAFVQEHHASLVAGQEVYYLGGDDRLAWETMRKIENGYAAEDDLTEDYAFPKEKEMQQKFKKLPEALANSLKIAERCTVELVLGKFVFPAFPLPPNKTADELLHDLCMEGARARGVAEDALVLERLEYELGIIKFKGYAMYFLVVEDLIRFAREHDIYYNIRGSVAGSMTTYLLQITKIDPLEYKIPFERFLNPERPSAPDIDMDFADDRRDEVIRYARAKYGETRVAQIGTFGTMLARGVVRDVARALGYPYGLGDRVAKEIPFGSQGFAMTLDRALTENPELGKLYKADQEVKEVIDLGKKIEGCARHISVHAAGVVISPKPLVDYAPLQHDPKGGKLITQYDMYSVGEDGIGLTKFDFLGIRNLTILAEAVRLIEKLRGVKVDIEAITMDDAKTFKMLAEGKTEGVFQMGGAGMTKWLVELGPTTIHDINAMVALYRPGPMQFIPDYIKRKHNPELVTYLDPVMEPILKQTYGVLVYQDDLLIMANQLAGYSWGEVDKFRKAVGKKIPEEMAAQKEKFIQGCVTHVGWKLAKAQEVWAWIEPFAAYGFNKAHSASYGRVAYQTAYMKANFPVEYMTAVLTAESGNMDTITTMIAECKRMHIPVLPPDVNESFGDFTVIDDSIRFGLYSIKNFGAGVSDSIIAERKKNGRFSSLSDFLSRITDSNLNKKGLESLIECGALDSLYQSTSGQEYTDGGRGQMLAAIETLLQYHRDVVKESSHDSLFGALGGTTSELKLPPAPEVPMETRLAWEKELLGLYVSGHPLDRFKEKLDKRTMTIGQMRTQVMPGATTVAAGMVEDVRVILTKGGDQMAFIKIADYDGSIEAVIFPKSFAEYKSIIQPDMCIALKGKLSNRNGELSLVADALKAL